jgi:drug/metabolite transporter (DMT)-like permease
VSRNPSNTTLAAGLLTAVVLWGGTNAGTRFVVQSWPPIWTGGTRFLCAGLLMLAMLRWTQLLGKPTPLSSRLRLEFWWRGGLSLAIYIICFNWAMRLTTASHVALYLGASPVWALLWEERPAWSRASVQKYAAAGLALGGVLVLFWPALGSDRSDWRGEMLGIIVSILWTHYGRQCRVLGSHLPGPEVTAHTMWRTGVLLMPLGLLEVAGWSRSIDWSSDLLLVHGYCILAGSIAAFALWNSALRHWPTSKVLLFNNLIPVSTMTWAHFCLGEAVTGTFWIAMLLIVAGVVLGQTNWQKLTPASSVPPE